MTVREMVFKYTTKNSQAAQRADSAVRRSVRETGKVARKQSSVVDRWMSRQKRSIQLIGAATGAALGGIISMGPTFRATLSGIRIGFVLLSETLLRDVFPNFTNLTGAVINAVQWYRDLDDSIRRPISALIVFAGILGTVVASIAIIGKVVGAFISTLGALVGVKAAVVAGAKLLGAALLTLVGIIGIVPLAIIAVIAIAAALVWTFREQIWNAIQFLGSGLVSLAQWFWDLGGRAIAAISHMASGVIGWFGDLAARATSIVGELYAGVRDWFGSLLSRLRIVASDIYGAVTSRMSELVTSTVGFAKDIYTGVRDWITDIAARAWSWGRDIIDRLASGISSAASSLVSALSSVGRNAADAFKNAFNAVIPSSLSIPRVSISIPSILGGGSRSIGGGSLNLPQLRTGGLIDQSGLAMVHRGERVMPAAQVSERGRQPVGGPMEFNFGDIVIQSRGSARRDAQDIVEEVSREFETRLGGRGVSR